jgi:putative hemolysin
MIEQLNNHDVNQIGTIISCLIGSAFFSASETAMTSLGGLKAKHIVEQNGGKAKQLKLWINYPNRVITTILIFNNIVNILASAIATDFATRHFQSQAIGVATGTITFLVLVFGEVVPKSFAKANAEKLSLWVMSIVTLFYYLAFPLVFILTALTHHILRLLGSSATDTTSVSEEELEFLVNISEKSGNIPETKKEMLVGIFDIDEVKVREIMTPRTDIESITVKDSLDDAIKIAINTGYSRLPIEHEDDGIDHITGVLLVKDLLSLAQSKDKPKNLSIAKLSRKAIFVPEAKSLLNVLKDLKRTKNQMAIVVDEHGGTAGIVTLEDIIEEIVGEIQDETDSEEADISEIDSGIFDISGSININDFVEYFDLNEDKYIKDIADFETLAGLIVERVGDLPKKGQTIRIGPLNAEVTEVERQRIERVRVSRIYSIGEEESEEDLEEDLPKESISD